MGTESTKIRDKLWAHQERLLIELSRREFFGLWCDMGTGKTAPTLCRVEDLHKTKSVERTLIITVKAAILNWRLEAEEWTPDIADAFVLLRGSTKKKLALLQDKPRIVVVNYEAFVSEEFSKAIKRWRPECVILDESHKIKSPDAKRTKRILAITAGARYRYALSGSPILKGLEDIYTQLRFLEGPSGAIWGRGSTYKRWFWKRFVNLNAKKSWCNWPDYRPLPWAQEEITELMQRHGAVIRKEEVLKDLPPFVQKTLHCEMSREQARAYRELEKDLLTAIPEDAGFMVVTTAAVRLLRCLQMCSGLYSREDGEVIQETKNSKYDALEDLLESVCSKHSVVVWTPWIQTYCPIGKVCEKLGLPYSYIVGGQRDDVRDDAIAGFQSGEYKVIIANPAAGGVGINLTAASYMVYFSRTYNLEHDQQSEARSYRGGSEIHDKITRIDLVSVLPDGTPTVEDQVRRSLAAKETLQQMVLGIRDGRSRDRQEGLKAKTA